MNKKITVSPRWHGAVPMKNGKPLPKNQWARAGRKRTWAVRWRAPDGTRPRQTFETKEEAEAFTRSKVAEFEQHGPQARCRLKQITIGEFRDELLTLRIGPRGQRLSIGALREYRTILTRFAQHVGEQTPLDQITIADATRHIASLRRASSAHKPLSPNSVNKHKRTLKSAMNVAVLQLRYLTINPFAGLKKDKVADQAIRYVDAGEFAAIVAACRQMANPLWWEAYLTVLYTSGARANEATHLTWDDIDFAEGSIRIIAKPEIAGMEAWRPKDLDSRIVPVPETTINLLSRLHAQAADGSEFVFLSPGRIAWIAQKRQLGTWAEGQQILNNSRTNFQRRAKKAGVEHVTLHDLRRACITHWAKGLASPVVQELAGHADIKTTLKYYVSLRAEDLAAAREVTANAMLVDPKWTQKGEHDTECSTISDPDPRLR